MEASLRSLTSKNRLLILSALAQFFVHGNVSVEIPKARAPVAHGRTVHARHDGTYVNPNRKLPRAQMLKARLAEQRSRRGSL
jgi:hypothetical protein